MTWTRKPVGEVARDALLGMHLTRRGSDPDGQEQSVLSVGDIGADGSLAPRASLATRRLHLRDSDLRYVVRRGDIVVSARGTQIKAARIGTAHDGTIASYTLIIIRPGPLMSSALLFAFLSSAYGQAELRARARLSTATLILNLQDVLALEVPVPPLDLQHRLTRLIEAEESHYMMTQEVALERRTLVSTTVEHLLMHGRIVTETEEKK